MTSEQLALWVPEPCHAAAPAPADWTDDRLAEWLHSRTRPITADHGRPAGRGDAWRLFKPVIDVAVQGDLL